MDSNSTPNPALAEFFQIQAEIQAENRLLREFANSTEVQQVLSRHPDAASVSGWISKGLRPVLRVEVDIELAEGDDITDIATDVSYVEQWLEFRSERVILDSPRGIVKLQVLARQHLSKEGILLLKSLGKGARAAALEGP